MYRPVSSSEIIERVEHIRQLHRQNETIHNRDPVARQRNERRVKDFISNLRRTDARPTANMVLALADACSLTTDGAYRLFGFELDGVRELDLHLNGGRTHIVESYLFNRDLMVELPLELAQAEAFHRSALLSTLVLRWQGDFSARVLDRPMWRRPGTFYVHIGTEDSHGSGLPPGSTALVEPIGPEEMQRPNPRAIYLLQFRNGYRCSRCVVTAGKLQMLSSDRSFDGPQVFSYPLSVRIAGRIAAFALGLPLRDHPPLRPVSQYHGDAHLILPWENKTRHGLFATKHRRFVRPPEESHNVEEALRSELQSTLSDRTRRRYRRESDSEPHIAALIQMSIEHYARYSDSLRTGGYALRDRGRFSLDTLLRARHPTDLPRILAEPQHPTPTEVWEARRKEMIEWPALLSLKFPRPSAWSHRAIRLGEESSINLVQPPIRPGSWMILEELPAVPDTRNEGTKRGWSRPLYALTRGVDMAFGYLERDGTNSILLCGTGAPHASVKLQHDEINNLRRVSGVAVRV